jgi:hypothetical protein
MKNPWLMKNPLMSIWLSSAHRVLGTARGTAVAAAKRQSATMMTDATRQALRFWTGGVASTATRKRKKSR